MKVAYLVSRFPHLPESFVLREIDALEREGIEVLLCPLLRHREPVSHPAAAPWVERAVYTPFVSASLLRAAGAALARRPLRVSGTYGSALFRVAGTPNFLLGMAGIALKLPYLAARLEAEGVAHVHAHFATHPALAAWAISRLNGIGYSFTAHAHDIYVHTAMLREKMAAARFVVTVSEYNRRLLSRFGDVGKVHVVRCGIDLSRYAFRARDPGHPFSILSVASLQPYKGLEHLVRACGILRDRGRGPFRCEIIGGGEEREALERWIRTLALEECVRLAGPRPEEDVAAALNAADAFVLPSVVTPSGKMEGLPVSLVEALAVGVPAISTSISGIPEIVVPGETGLLVPPAEPERLAEAIEQVILDPAGARERAAKGRRLVEAEFSLDRSARELAERFRQAA